MCGIYCSIVCKGCEKSSEHEIVEATRKRCVDLSKRRGPDCTHEAKADVAGVTCHLIGCVLWMQGGRPAPQPIADEQGNLLLWNGEVFNDPWPREAGASDSLALSGALSRVDRTAANLLDVLSRVRGPFAFAYLDAARGRLWFGRDRVGRHSLLWRAGVGQLELCSAAGEGRWREVGAAGVYCVRLGEGLPVTLYPWSDITPDVDVIPGIDLASLVSSSAIATPLSPPATPLPPPDHVRRLFEGFDDSAATHGEILDALSSCEAVSREVTRLLEVMRRAVKVRVDTQPGLCRRCVGGDERRQNEAHFAEGDSRVETSPPSDKSRGCGLITEPLERLDICAERIGCDNAAGGIVMPEVGARPAARCAHPKVGILFSGGLDSAVLAALADAFVPRSEAIDLVNVAFQRSPKRGRARNEDKRDKGGRKRDKRKGDGRKREANGAQCNATPSERETNCEVAAQLDATHNKYDSNSEVDTQHNVARNKHGGDPEVKERHNATRDKLGTDSEFDAQHGATRGELFAARVGAERLGDPCVGDGVDYNVPDRKTGRQTLEELRRVFPERRWNFIEVNVTQPELAAKRASRISDLISPLDTILDDSLGCALWFAARARGGLDGADYTSPARILLLGMGADEQLGGYMRHRTALRAGGWTALAAHLAADLGNIAARNLGRDDRVVSDSGRQGRLPYLDEEVVSFLGRLQPWQKCYPVPCLPPGVGDKYLLRLAARRLGLLATSVLPKRAMQFGSRIADGREKGGDACARLQAARE